MTIPIDRSSGLFRLDQSTGTLRSRQYVVRVTAGPDAGVERALQGVTLVGTHPDARLCLKDPTISRYHLELTPRADGVQVRDLGSRNGVFLGGTRIQELIVETDTTVWVGKSALQITIAESDLGRLEGGTSFGKVVGQSAPMRKLIGILERVAPSDSTVLLTGESGTGKEVLAEAIHLASHRREHKLVVFDCAAVAPTLIESELFGHLKGAFTGAVSDRNGAVLEADGGTLFLDEIGELPLAMQPKLLRALETRTVRRLGEDKERTVDLRVIAATHRNLQEEVKAGRFRLDLYYRLEVMWVKVPPLRDRPEDLPLLTRAFLNQMGRREVEFSDELMEKLAAYDWPGNVRELRNVVERALSGADLEEAMHPSGKPRDASYQALQELPFKEGKDRLVEAFTRDYFTALFKRCGGNISKTAQAAGIARTYAHRLVTRYGLRGTDEAE